MKLRQWQPILTNGIEWVLSQFYPNICQLCSNYPAKPSEGYICTFCRAALKHVQPPFCERCGLPVEGAIENSFLCNVCLEEPIHFRMARAGVILNDLSARIIHSYKYNRALWFEPLLVDLLFHAAQRCMEQVQPDIIVPVPLHRLKKREREFNQAERLSRSLSKSLGIPVNTRLLQRVLPTESQTFLSPKERKQNVANAFTFVSRDKLKELNVLLIDDVFTTGATTNACSKILLQNGAFSVSVCTVARTTRK